MANPSRFVIRGFPPYAAFVAGTVVDAVLPGDGCTEGLFERGDGRARRQFLHATIGSVGPPRAASNGEYFVRVELPRRSKKPRTLFVAASAIRRYFYLLGTDPPQSLYGLLKTGSSATADQLRLAWRMRSLELQVKGAGPRPYSALERAFNILAHPDLRACYDAMRMDDDAAPLFPYGGVGVILVEGRLADDSDAFFADHILAYKPDMTTRKVSLLLRQCEFVRDRVILTDARRKLEVWLDRRLLAGLDWDLTWNHWKHWLKSRVEVEATFVHGGQYRVALPSRIHVAVPSGLAEDVQQARAIHTLLGRHASLIDHTRAQSDKAPVDHRQIEDWFAEIGASKHLQPQHVNWKPDYETFFFEQLRRRCASWFVIRDEYLFVWRDVVIAEIPAPGHATYLFAKPADLSTFLDRYARLSRAEILDNRGGEAGELGFVGRVVHGRRNKRWLRDVLRLAGEKPEDVDAL